MTSWTPEDWYSLNSRHSNSRIISSDVPYAPAKKPRRKKEYKQKLTSTDGYEDIECNGRLIREISSDMQLPISVMESMVHHYGQFTARTIRSGSLEGVCVPFLGKFQVKHDTEQYRDYLHSLHPVMKKLFKKTAPENIDQLLKV